jgi:hypothetical protein
VARSIHWRPVVEGVVPVAVEEHAVFITQGTLREISRHVWTTPAQDVLGFLLGERFVSPETGRSFTVLSATTRTSYIIAEDGSEQIAADAYQAAVMEARRRRLTLAGWYRSAPFVGDRPPGGDLLAHRRYFPEPWQVALLAAPRAERPAGGIYHDPLGTPASFVGFYEIVDDDALTPDGQKRSVLAWENYLPDRPPSRTTKVAAPRPRIAGPGAGNIRVLVPKGHPDEQRRGKKRPKPSMKMSVRRRRERRRRILILSATLTFLAFAGAVGAVML